MINGKHLINFGYKPGPHFPAMIQAANECLEKTDSVIKLLDILDDIYESEFLENKIETIPLQENMEYEKLEKIGEGSFGKVSI